MFRKAILPLVLSLGLFVGTAHAASEELRYNDLDLTTEAGKAELDQRIDRVAQQLCANPIQTGTRIQMRYRGAQMKDCTDAVRAEVMSKLAKSKLAKR